LFAVAIVIMGVGTGMFKSNVSPLIAEQVTRQRAVVEERKGTKVLVDPALTTARLSLVGQIGMVYAEKYVGFWLSYLLPTIVFLICPAILIFGKKFYVLRPPAGSV
jgi:POT family proton-dependent oligopeptide transporter